MNKNPNRGAEMKFTAVFEKVPEGYIGFVEELPGANIQGATLEEARTNLPRPRDCGAIATEPPWLPSTATLWQPIFQS
jgi:hypothetical protein